MNNDIIVFTDGSSSGNPGPGGWGAVIACPQPMKGDCDEVVELGGREEHTTNNRMELKAVIEALKTLGVVQGDVVVHTDSSYVILGITKWVHGWISRGWITSTKESVSNRDLWEELLAVVEKREQYGKIMWKQIEGHVGIPGNERVDRIATAFTDNRVPDLYDGPRAKYPVNLATVIANTTDKTIKEHKKSRSGQKAYSYLSMVNGEIQIHATWAECEARVKGMKNAKFKKALSAQEEDQIKKEWKTL